MITSRNSQMLNQDYYCWFHLMYVLLIINSCTYVSLILIFILRAWRNNVHTYMGCMDILPLIHMYTSKFISLLLHQTVSSIYVDWIHVYETHMNPQVTYYTYWHLLYYIMMNLAFNYMISFNLSIILLVYLLNRFSSVWYH